MWLRLTVGAHARHYRSRAAGLRASLARAVDRSCELLRRHIGSCYTRSVRVGGGLGPER